MRCVPAPMSSTLCDAIAKRLRQTRSLPFFPGSIRFLSEGDVPVDSGEFSVHDRWVVDAVESLPKQLRFLRGLRWWEPPDREKWRISPAYANFIGLFVPLMYLPGEESVEV
jgi:hypothetical protein